MPNHVRRQIRDAVEALVTGLPSTGSRVYSGRARPLGKDHGDCLLVYTTDESSDRETIGQNPLLSRIVNVAIEGRVSRSSSEAAEDALDQIAAEVEPVMAGAAPRLGGLAREMLLIATRLLVAASGERHEGEIRLLYRVTYATRAATPTVAA